MSSFTLCQLIRFLDQVDGYTSSNPSAGIFANSAVITLINKFNIGLALAPAQFSEDFNNLTSSKNCERIRDIYRILTKLSEFRILLACAPRKASMDIGQYTD
eukprot:6202383-Pleurochrysis_carterae.AAC.4